MKRQQLAEIKQLTVKEILTKVIVSKKELSNLILDKNMDKLKDKKVLAKKKKDIAQMLTVARQKQLLEQLESVIDDKKGSKKI